MFKKYSAALFVLLAAVVFAPAGRAQETEAAASSNLTGVALPAGASRVLPDSVPAEVTRAFDKISAAGADKFDNGATEVLVWGGADYRKANAAGIVGRLTEALRRAGWQYSVEGDEGGLTVFTAFREGSPRRAVIGFHGATDDALVFAWMEVLPRGAATADRPTAPQRPAEADAAPDDAAPTGGGSIVGTWSNGGTALLGEKYQNGTVASRGGRTYKYVFNANGTFEFVGYMESTMYGCTTSLFNDKRGTYRISGDRITLNLSKNFWRNQYSCSPASNKERDYKLDPETYTFSVRRGEYGRDQICLNSGSGDACYERQK